jgi:hypothetical protein
MVKKMPRAPRAAKRAAKTDVVTRVPTETISDRAYTLFQARGCEHGHDVEDWLVAEAELARFHADRVRDSLDERRDAIE